MSWLTLEVYVDARELVLPLADYSTLENRTGTTPHLGNVVELTLVSWAWESWPPGFESLVRWSHLCQGSARELALVV